MADGTRKTDPRRAAIVLAAGRGDRMGGPKAWLVIDDKPLLLLHVERALDAGCARVVVVVSHERIARVLDALDARGRGRIHVALSNAPDQAGSLANGVRALAAPHPRSPRANDGVSPFTAGAKLAPESVLITPVDAVPAAVATIDLLFGALGVDERARAASPLYRGRGGHPVLCRFDVLAEYASATSAPQPLRETLAALGGCRVRVEVDDPAVGVDLDTPADVLALTGAAPLFFLLPLPRRRATSAHS